MIIGMKLKRLKVEGISEIKKISQKELKIIFSSKETASAFLRGNIPNVLKLNAYIPKYSITKVGIIFDIPAKLDDNYLRQNLESDLPIVDIYRCQKRKFTSDKHGGTSVDCPEYLRNKLIKEAMYYQNITFSEANEQFPRTQSQFRLAERRLEFAAHERQRKT